MLCAFVASVGVGVVAGGGGGDIELVDAAEDSDVVRVCAASLPASLLALLPAALTLWLSATRLSTSVVLASRLNFLCKYRALFQVFGSAAGAVAGAAAVVASAVLTVAFISLLLLLTSCCCCCCDFSLLRTNSF